MDRLWLTLLVFAFFLLCVLGMWRGWRRKAREQSARVALFPPIPEHKGEQVLTPAEGLYVSTTVSGRWQERIVTRGVGLRTSATLRCYQDGVEVDRVGAKPLWIPRDSIVDVSVGKAMAGKVMGTSSLLVLTWRLDGAVLDTGFRGNDLGNYPQWIDELVRTGAESTNDREIKGGVSS